MPQDLIDLATFASYTILVTAKVREDYGHKLHEWDEMDLDQATARIAAGYVSNEAAAATAFHVVNDYAKCNC